MCVMGGNDCMIDAPFMTSNVFVCVSLFVLLLMMMSALIVLIDLSMTTPSSHMVCVCWIWDDLSCLVEVCVCVWMLFLGMSTARAIV